MFVQIEELPSIYSRPRLSTRTAPRPATSTRGSCSGAHHSGMFVNGGQINLLSAAHLRLEAPGPAELCRSDLAFATFDILLCPYMLTGHGGKILHYPP